MLCTWLFEEMVFHLEERLSSAVVVAVGTSSQLPLTVVEDTKTDLYITAWMSPKQIACKKNQNIVWTSHRHTPQQQCWFSLAAGILRCSPPPVKCRPLQTSSSNQLPRMVVPHTIALTQRMWAASTRSDTCWMLVHITLWSLIYITAPVAHQKGKGGGVQEAFLVVIFKISPPVNCSSRETQRPMGT